MISNTNSNELAKNTTHANSSHVLTIRVTVTDTNLLDGEITGDSDLSSNYDAGVLIEESEITVSKTNTVSGCKLTFKEGTTSKVSATKFTQDFIIENCSGDGTITISVAASKSLDLADNTSNESSNTLTYTIDNTAPVVSLKFESNSNPVDDTYLGMGHTLTFTATITDVNLLIFIKPYKVSLSFSYL